MRPLIDLCPRLLICFNAGGPEFQSESCCCLLAGFKGGNTGFSMGPDQKNVCPHGDVSLPELLRSGGPAKVHSCNREQFY